jgi:hypothetical protein
MSVIKRVEEREEAWEKEGGSRKRNLVSGSLIFLIGVVLIVISLMASLISLGSLSPSTIAMINSIAHSEYLPMYWLISLVFLVVGYYIFNKK